MLKPGQKIVIEGTSGVGIRLCPPAGMDLMEVQAYLLHAAFECNGAVQKQRQGQIVIPRGVKLN
jgi:hypothetical protein